VNIQPPEMTTLSKPIMFCGWIHRASDEESKILGKKVKATGWKEEVGNDDGKTDEAGQMTLSQHIVTKR
jgi:hypothetical protein